MLGTHLRFKAPRQHAAVAERHNALLRDTLHRMESQCVLESRRPTMDIILSYAIHMKNLLT
eukprot:1141872-Amphidinium_carterae.1